MGLFRQNKGVYPERKVNIERIKIHNDTTYLLLRIFILT